MCIGVDPNADMDDDAMAIPDALDDEYIMLLDSSDEPTIAARECEQLRDEIHWNNFHKD